MTVQTFTGDPLDPPATTSSADIWRSVRDRLLHPQPPHRG